MLMEGEYCYFAIFGNYVLLVGKMADTWKVLHNYGVDSIPFFATKHQLVVMRLHVNVFCDSLTEL